MTDIVSVIITILDGEKWIDKCFASILKNILDIQDSSLSIIIEVCVFDDSSQDTTLKLLKFWKCELSRYGTQLKIIRNCAELPKGVGYGRNAAINISTGSYLCFQDIDDEMLPKRIVKQYNLAKLNQDAIIGCKFIRSPENSTNRYQRWANNIDHKKLNIQIYTSNGPSVIMPTWFCSRKVYDRISGGFCEDGKGTPEDLLFFYKHLDMGGRICRVDDILLLYRYHLNSTTFSISQQTIWNIRLNRLIQKVLQYDQWQKGFTIWNAGRQGRRFFRDIPIDLKNRVLAFCDVDKNKIHKNYEYYDEIKRKVTYSIPIINYINAKPPIIICMKLDLTHGEFEENLNSLMLIEGKDYIIFS